MVEIFFIARALCRDACVQGETDAKMLATGGHSKGKI